MSAQKRTVGGVFGAIAGMLGFSAIAGVLVTVMVTPAIAVTGMTATTSIDIFETLPTYIEIGQQRERNRIFAKSGDEYVQIATVWSQNREEVGWDDVSQYAKDAAISGEDRHFYEHNGVYIPSVIRAAVGNLAAGEIESGASTLTMQLVKNIQVQKTLEIENAELREQAYWDAVDPKGYDRKLKEMKLAISLEKKYSKEDILLAYLNIANFGNATYGIEAAAERYYSTSAKDLTIAQAASLLAIVQQPGARNLGDPENYEANKQRRDQILTRMLEDERITKAEYDEAIATPVDETTVALSPPKSGCRNAHQYAKLMCDYVVKSIDELEALGSNPEQRKANWEHGGYDVYTSLDVKLNKVATQSILKYAPANEKRFKLGSAVASVEAGTGWIITMAQNKTFDDAPEAADDPTKTAINFTSDKAYGGSNGFRAGSTFKLFTLIEWLKAGHGLNEVLDATPKTRQISQFTNSCVGMGGSSWRTKNSAGETGPWSVINATASSVNNIFVEMALQLDLCAIAKTAEALGVHSANGDPIKSQFPAFILGSANDNVSPITMAAAYAGIANGGVYCKPIAVTHVIDQDGNELPGETSECSRAVDPSVNAAAIYALQRGMSRYPSNPHDGTPMFGKTGTTDAAEQTWVMGVSSKVATATWVGNIIGDASMYRMNMSLARHYIARPILAAINARYGGDGFPSPESRFLSGAAAPVIPAEIIGISAEGAKAALEALGLTYQDGGQIDSDLPAGQVAKTDPAPGTKVARGTIVKVYTSKGNLAIIPDVVSGNPQYADAVAALNAAGFTNVTEVCEVIAPPSPPDDPGGDPTMAGRVTAVDPAVGTAAPKDAAVQLTVKRMSC